MSLQRHLAILLILAFVTPSVGAQAGGWTSGISDESVENNGVYLPNSEDESLQIEIYIDNSGSVDSSFEIEVELCTDCAPETNQENEWVVDYPDSMTVSGGANETLLVSISNVQAAEFNAERTIDLTVSITYLDSQGVARPDYQRTDEHEIILRIPQLIVLDAEWKQTPGGPISAGSETTLVLSITNSGNSGTRIDTFTVSEGGKCPQLDLQTSPDVPVEINRGTSEDFRILVSASSAHPTKRCTITISARTDDDITTGALSTEVSVEKISTTDESDSELDTSSSTYQSGEGDGLPAPSFLLLLCVIALAARRKIQDESIDLCVCPSVEKFE